MADNNNGESTKKGAVGGAGITALLWAGLEMYRLTGAVPTVPITELHEVRNSINAKVVACEQARAEEQKTLRANIMKIFEECCKPQLKRGAQ